MKKNMKNLTRSGEQGIALVFTLFLMAALSALAVSLMFLSQTETSSTRNYRTMSQARYAGEAGVHKAINYLTSPTSYTPPGSLANYNLTVSPVVCTSGCATVGPVVLSARSDVASNYPDAAVVSAFNTAVQGTLATNVGGVTSNAALQTVTYGASAKLMSMRGVTSYGGGTGVIQTWEISAVGTVPGALPATVEVTALVERQLVDAQTFAVFATGTGCGAISMNGNAGTGSYDSGVGTATTTSGGNMGTNGNMTIVGSVDVHGSLSSPRPGVGSCVDGSGVTALTQTGAASVDTGVVQLPQALNFETPALPSPMPPITATSTCAQFVIAIPGTCTISGGVTTIDPMGSLTPVRMGNISGNFVLKGGNYAINSIGSGDLSLGTSLAGNTKVTINLAGKTATGDLANPFNLNGNAIVNPDPNLDASRLQILYAGTGTIDMTGGSAAAFVLYAPNATVSTHGNADIYGSILSKQLTTAGNTRFFYDKKLDRTAFTMGNFTLSAFSWKKY